MESLQQTAPYTRLLPYRSLRLSQSLWQQCIHHLEDDLNEGQLNTWIHPLQVQTQGNQFCLLAPNRFVLDYVRQNFLPRIRVIMQQLDETNNLEVLIRIGSLNKTPTADPAKQTVAENQPKPVLLKGINQQQTFETFVEGKSNQLARAASIQVSQNPGSEYNPLYIYGGTGLGKSHLIQAIANKLHEINPEKSIVYVNSETFIHDMVRALQHNKMNEFKKFYRSADTLLIDDIQFLSDKNRSQEEFFHTFNSLYEAQAQIVVSCDRYPRELNGLEDRIRSRLGWGLTVDIQPPDLETRVAILKSKAQIAGVVLPDEVAFFISKRIRSHIRDLEGALNRVIAHTRLTGKPISLDYAREALKDLIAAQEKQVSIENIQKTVAEYFKIRISDLHSNRRTRSITRPRQIAMALAKELTRHSLPEIGNAFGGRDHTTVLHACRKVQELRQSDSRIEEDYRNLERILTL